MARGDLQQLARDHLWMHFTRMGGFGDGNDVPIIVKGDGCHLWDSNGKRYLDALAGLFSVNIGYGYGEEIGQAALEQMRELPFYTNWSYAHPKAIELAAELASLAPGDLNRVFFVSGGSEAVEAAWKLARQYYGARGEKHLRNAVTEPETRHDSIIAAGRRGPHRYKAIARHIAYHGTTMGALSINGIPALRATFEPLVPEVRHVHNTNRYHRPDSETEEDFTQFLLDDLEQAILAMGPETVCLVHMEPVQNAGGCFTPPVGYWQGVRAICDEYDILLSADEVITGFGRLGHWFGSERYDIRPDMITCAKGLSSSYGSYRRCDRPRRSDGAVPRRHLDLLPRNHLRRTSRDVRDRPEGDRDHEEGGRRRARARHAGRLPRQARDTARSADRRRHSRDRVLLCDRARQGSRDESDVRRRRMRVTAARFSLACAVRGRLDLSPG